MNLESAYLFLPTAAQHLITSAYGFAHHRSRFGKDWRRLVKEYEERSDWTLDKIENFRNKSLQAAVEHAALKSQFHSDRFKALGVDPKSIKCMEDLQRLPILTKDEVRTNRDLIISHEHRSVKWMKTSGTTGSGLQFPATKSHFDHLWAVWGRYFRSHGINPDTELCAQFAGRIMVPSDPRDDVYWRFNWGGHQIRFSIFHLSEETFAYYLDALRRFKPRWIHGYPSAISLLASYLHSSGKELGYNVKWITLSAENVLPIHRQHIRSAFGIEPIEHYGMAEGAASASYREGAYVVDEDFSILEMVPGDEDGQFRVVGTCLNNPAFPLFRYDVGDLVSFTGEVNEFGWRVLRSLDGRTEDYVRTPDGRKVSHLEHVFRDLINLREAQIIQAEATRILVKMVCDDFSKRPECEAEVRVGLEKRLGNDMDIDFEWVDKIALSGQGKLRLVVSKLSGR